MSKREEPIFPSNLFMAALEYEKEAQAKQAEQDNEKESADND